MSIRTRTSSITFEVAPPPVTAAVYSGPGDIVAGADLWWGLRAYSAATIGANAVRLREDGGNTEQDFATIAGGGLDLAAITAFKGANNLFVVTLYDQVGANHLTQATAGKQPAFILSALGALPAMQFTAALVTTLRSTAGAASNQPFTHTFVMNLTSIGSATRPFGGEGVIDVWLFELGGANTMELYAGLVSGSAAFSAGSWHAAQAIFNDAASSITVDGATTGGLATGANNFGGNFMVMGDDRSGGLAPISGYIGEAGIWPSGFDATQLANMNTNQHNYWGF